MKYQSSSGNPVSCMDLKGQTKPDGRVSVNPKSCPGTTVKFEAQQVVEAHLQKHLK